MEDEEKLQEEIVLLKKKLGKSEEDFKKSLERATRLEKQVEKATSYSKELEERLDTLSKELQVYRLKQKNGVSIGVQVDCTNIDYSADSKCNEVQPQADTCMSVTQDGSMVHGYVSSAAVSGVDDEEAMKQHESGDASTEPMSISDSLRSAAEEVVQQSGYVFDEKSGMYYDYNTGYYYDNEKSLYYDPASGTYFYYDHATSEYKFHSQVSWHQYTTNSQYHDLDKPNEEKTEKSSKERKKAREHTKKNGRGSKRKHKKKEKRKEKKERSRKKKKDKSHDDKSERSRKGRSERSQKDKSERTREKSERGDDDRNERRHKDKNERSHETSERCDNDRSDRSHRDRGESHKDRSERSREKSETGDDDRSERSHRDRGESHKDRSERSREKSETGDNDRSERSHRDRGESHKDRSERSRDKKRNKRKREKDESDKLSMKKRKNDSEKDKASSIQGGGVESDTAKPTSIVGSGVSYKDGGLGKESVEGKEQKMDYKNCNIFEKVDKETPSEVTLKMEGISEGGDDNDKTESGECLPCDIEKEENASDIVVKMEGTSDVCEEENGDDVEAVVVVVSSSEDSDLEEGEISSLTSSESSDSEEDSDSDSSSESESDSDSDSDSESSVIVEEKIEENSKAWPPCIRAMVKSSDKLDRGSLFLITCTGATIGREKDLGHAILIQDLAVSKMHAVVKYNEDFKRYVLIDQASQNGTFVNGERVCEPKVMSDPKPLFHGDELKIGNTVLELHIHPGTDTCEGCEPGLVLAQIQQEVKNDAEVNVVSKEEKEIHRRKQLKQIKRKFGLENASFTDNMGAINNPKYQDKASERRRVKGSDNPYQKDDAPASVDRAISTENKGRKLLQKMGWSEGETLGKSQKGLKVPIKVNIRSKPQAGLGSAVNFEVSMDNVRDARKMGQWSKMQQRFAGLEPQSLKTEEPTQSWISGGTVMEMAPESGEKPVTVKSESEDNGKPSGGCVTGEKPMETVTIKSEVDSGPS